MPYEITEEVYNDMLRLQKKRENAQYGYVFNQRHLFDFFEHDSALLEWVNKTHNPITIAKKVTAIINFMIDDNEFNTFILPKRTVEVKVGNMMTQYDVPFNVDDREVLNYLYKEDRLNV